LQELLYAEHKQSLLICLQAMDAGGKDGVIRHALGAMNPQGCKVYSFRKPNSVELDHDFMWRAYRDVPAKGEVAIFNRSHYEDVLVVRVHDLVSRKALDRRYEEINAIEKHLCENDTHILKFFLHISKDEQLKRFKDRLDNPRKHWKISESDYTERKYWNEYQEAFEAMLSKCSTRQAPWFVIPANHKWFRDLAILQIMVEYLEGLKMRYPKPAVDIDKIRKQYHKAKKGK
jgi:PPK2 family polyphosphate:nucleotide phosphotransferase